MASLMRCVYDWLDSFVSRRGMRQSRSSDGYISLDGPNAQVLLNDDVLEKNPEKALDDKTSPMLTDNDEQTTKGKKTLGTGLEWLRYMEGFS
ncbi:MAG: hypothetical protein Q9183_002876, partial [Haloplaca sp. 2 TL-2023]